MRSLEDHLPLDFCCICLYDPAQQALTVTASAAQRQPSPRELGDGASSVAIADRPERPGALRRAASWSTSRTSARVDFPFPQRLARGGLRSLVAAPLLVESQVFGVLVAARRQRRASAAATASSCAS